MRIVDLGEFYSERGGGVRSYLGALLEASGARGHEVVVVAPGPRDTEERVPGGRILRYRAPRMPYDGSYHLPFRLDLMRRWVRTLAPDVLQLSSPYLPWLAMRQLHAPVRSYIYHSDPIGAYVEPWAARVLPGSWERTAVRAAWSWIRAVCHSSDLTVVSGDWLRLKLTRHAVTRVECLPFGIEHERFGPQHRCSKLRSDLLGEWSTDPAARVLVMGGRLAVEKRQALLIRAAGELGRSRPLALVVLGDGPERARLEALAQRTLQRCRFISFTRDRQEYARILASADALIHGSTCETYGFLLVEALASGTPLVVPAAGGAAHVADDGCSQEYPADGDERDVARAIERLLSQPAESTRAAALRAARLHPTKQQHFDALFDLYERRLQIARQRGTPAATSAPFGDAA